VLESMVMVLPDPSRGMGTRRNSTKPWQSRHAPTIWTRRQMWYTSFPANLHILTDPKVVAQHYFGDGKQMLAQFRLCFITASSTSNTAVTYFNLVFSYG